MKSVYAHEWVRRIGGSAQRWVSARLGIALGIPAGTGTIDGIARRAFRKALALIADIKDITMAQLPLNAKGVVPGLAKPCRRIIETDTSTHTREISE